MAAPTRADMSSSMSGGRSIRRAGVRSSHRWSAPGRAVHSTSNGRGPVANASARRSISSPVEGSAQWASSTCSTAGPLSARPRAHRTAAPRPAARRSSGGSPVVSEGR